MSATVLVSSDGLVAQTAAPKGRREYLPFMHSLRGLAITWVVSVHVLDCIARRTPRELSWQLLVYLFVSNATVPFIFVSGFLFQHLSDRYRASAYLWRRFATVILPYLVISMPAILHQYATHTGIYLHQDGRQPWAIALAAYLTGAHLTVPLWYIPVIAMYYLASPIFIRFVRQPWLYWSIAPLLVLATFLHRSYGHRVVWQSALYFLPVFLIGMAVSQYRQQVLAWVAPRRWLFLTCVLTVLVAAVTLNGHHGPIFSRHPFSTENGVLDLDLVGKVGLTIFCLDFLRRHDAPIRSGLAILADTSFGIFFLHGFLLQRMVAKPAWQQISGSAWAPLVFLLGVAGVVAICVVTVLAIQKLLGKRSRYLIGC